MLSKIQTEYFLLTFIFFLMTGISFPQAGSLDMTFGQNGIVTSAINVAVSKSQIISIVIQSDEKIVSAGYAPDNGGYTDFAVVRYNSNGSLDNSFGTNGVVTTDIGTIDAAQSVAIQSDGKIVASGYSNNGSNYDFALVRYNSNGSLDDTFGIEGKVTTQISSSGDFAYSMAIQSDGKIIAAGDANSHYVLVRYNPDGSLDNSFGSNGIVTTTIGSSSSARSVGIQNDGKILAAGYSNQSGNRDFTLVRYNQNGSLDNTFGLNGVSTIQIGVADDFAYSLNIQDDGKIIVAGHSSNGSDFDFALARFNTNGSLDNTFGNNGIVITQVGNSYDLAYSTTIQEDGKIIISGYSVTGSSYEFAIARYNSNGTLDNSFGTNGISITDLIGNYNDEPSSVAIQNSGRIVVSCFHKNLGYQDFALLGFNPDGTLDNTFGFAAGRVITSIGFTDSGIKSVVIQGDNKIIAGGYSNSSFTLARYNTDGSPDLNFGVGGFVTTYVSTYLAKIKDVALQDNDKIVAGGYSWIEGEGFRFTLARYNEDGTLDSSFGTNGIVITQIGTDDSQANSVVVQNDGKIIAAGNSYNGNDNDFALARYTDDGSLDNSFGSNGIVITQIGSGDEEINSLALQNDGKIIAAGYSYFGGFNSFTLVRYNQDGSLDLTFGSNGIVISGTGIFESVKIQNDGKIIAAGHSDEDFAVARYNQNGTLDNNFGSNGIVTTAIGALQDRAYSVNIQSDGKIIAAGYSDNGDNLVFTVVRYNSGGVLDNTFGNNGIVLTQIGASTNIAYASAIQTIGGGNEKIVVAGQSFSTNYRVFTLTRYNLDGSSSVEDGTIAPDKFVLYQNYPNPFNPTTKIKFSVPNSPLSFGEGPGVRLLVYDVLGNEIATLVNEEKPAGEYEVLFDASKLSSGIYFYQLTAGKFIDTKKLIFLK